MNYPNRILLATDGTDDSERAARVALTLGNATGAELHLVHVGQAAAENVSAGGNRPALPGEPAGYAERRARRMLDAQSESVRASGGTLGETYLRIGVPATEIVALAGEIGADLVVVGSGEPHNMRRAVAATTKRSAIGRTSDAVVRRAPCPVLVVRGGPPEGVGASPNEGR